MSVKEISEGENSMERCADLLSCSDLKTVRTTLFFALLCSLAFAIGGCGGGGGGNDGEPSTPEVPQTGDVCGAIGLGPKIINGVPCDLNGRSPIVRLISNYSSGRPGYCSGTMITPTKVLTAGHCGRNAFNPHDVRLRTVVLIGSSSGTRFVETTSVVVHPKFQVEGVHIFNDLAIATLAEPVDLPVLPVLTSFTPSAGAEVKIFGYGKTVVGTPQNHSFEQYLNEPLDLRSGTMTLSRVTDFHYDAEATSGKATICHGDSGGPLIYLFNGQPTVIGVTSQILPNNTTVHCSAGTTAEWTKLVAPSNLQELLALVPDVGTK